MIFVYFGTEIAYYWRGAPDGATSAILLQWAGVSTIVYLFTGVCIMATTITINKGSEFQFEHMDKDAGLITHKVGRVSPKSFQRFVDGAGDLVVPAFDDKKVFYGVAILSPEPKTMEDLMGLGYDLFESALSSACIKIQARIRSKGDGKQRIDSTIAELTKQLVAGKITMEELTRQVNDLTKGSGLVQL